MSENITVGIKVENDNPETDTETIVKEYYLYDMLEDCEIFRHQSEFSEQAIEMFEDLVESGEIDVDMNLYYQNALDPYEDARYQWFYKETKQ